MIGFWALLDQTLLITIPILLLLACAVLLWRSRPGATSVRAKLAIGVLIALLLVGSIRFVRQLNEHQRLSQLQAEEVASIEVASSTFKSQQDISRIVGALKEAQWFTSSHGGWGSEVPMTIHLRSGQERRYRVALYLREAGAVIILFKPWRNDSEARYGYAFSRSLPDALNAVGTRLTSERR